ncbi:MAG: hypothetical protein ABIK10_04215 [candidate division WOR-3 bacterium]
MFITDSNRRYMRWLEKFQVHARRRHQVRVSDRTKKHLQQAFQQLSQVEWITKSVLSATSTPTHLNFYYLAYARELYGLTKRYQDKNLERELEIVNYKWLRRGLDPKLLQRIRHALLSYLQLTNPSSTDDLSGTEKRG